SRKWGAALDLIYRHEKQDAFVTRGEGTNVTQAQGQSQETTPDNFEFSSSTLQQISVRAGMEIYLSDIWALRFGGYYEPRSTPHGTESADILSTHVDVFGGTLGLGLENDIGETTFGVD